MPLFFKYETLKYRFDESGVSMSWGLLWRREIHLTYRRIQDIHLTRGLIQRWMGLATVAIQTASGSSGPEMSIEELRCMTMTMTTTMNAEQLDNEWTMAAFTRHYGQDNNFQVIARVDVHMKVRECGCLIIEGNTVVCRQCKGAM